MRPGLNSQSYWPDDLPLLCPMANMKHVMFYARKYEYQSTSMVLLGRATYCCYRAKLPGPRT